MDECGRGPCRTEDPHRAGSRRERIVMELRRGAECDGGPRQALERSPRVHRGGQEDPPDAEGKVKHRPFHGYTMKQAVDERFILDVLNRKSRGPCEVPRGFAKPLVPRRSMSSTRHSSESTLPRCRRPTRRPSEGHFGSREVPRGLARSRRPTIAIESLHRPKAPKTLYMAEGVGFEPTVGDQPTPVLKTGVGEATTSSRRRCRRSCTSSTRRCGRASCAGRCRTDRP